MKVEIIVQNFFYTIKINWLTCEKVIKSRIPEFEHVQNFSLLKKKLIFILKLTNNLMINVFYFYNRVLTKNKN